MYRIEEVVCSCSSFYRQKICFCPVHAVYYHLIYRNCFSWKQLTKSSSSSEFAVFRFLTPSKVFLKPPVRAQQFFKFTNVVHSHCLNCQRYFQSVIYKMLAGYKSGKRFFSTNRLDKIKDKLHSRFPPLEFCMGYGSGIFKQKGYSENEVSQT